MAEVREYTVLVSRDGGDTWQPVTREATSADQAIGLVREDDEVLAADLKAQFFATARFEPKMMARQMIERWELTTVAEVEAQLERDAKAAG